MEIFLIVTQIIMGLLILKSITVGSDYNIYYRIKYGKKYSEWFFNRGTFEDYLKKESNNNG